MSAPKPRSADAYLDQLGALFPSCVRAHEEEDGTVRRVVDLDRLKQLLPSGAVWEAERNAFTWVGKSAAQAAAGQPINKHLRPCPEKSVDWDTTGNLYIEGDNLDALKLLLETHAGAVRLIYIDPPYNTGNDYIYNDSFASAGRGGRRRRAADEGSRPHAEWCSMIYPRLLLAEKLLSNDGCIFISIDDNEYDNLKRICDEVFGAGNFIANIIWKRKRGRDNSARWVSRAHEYCLLYAKERDCFHMGYLPLDRQTRKAYRNPDNDPRGDYRLLGCWARGTQGGARYAFTSKDGQFFPERLWLFSRENLTKLDEDDKLVIRGDRVYRKMFLCENRGKVPETIWDDVSNAANASDEIKKLFTDIVFETPKPTPYIRRMLELATDRQSVVLDFFSGSATTANAVMTLNAKDHGDRKYILVQLPEDVPEGSAAWKQGFRNICELGEERIRRAARLLREEGADGIDCGFRVYRVEDR